MHPHYTINGDYSPQPFDYENAAKLVILRRYHGRARDWHINADELSRRLVVCRIPEDLGHVIVVYGTPPHGSVVLPARGRPFYFGARGSVRLLSTESGTLAGFIGWWEEQQAKGLAEGAS